jgi:hypothetical protein
LTIIENYRCIKSLQLPAGWTESTPAVGIVTAVVRSFSPADNANVKMEIFCRGLPLSEESSKSFRKALKLAPKSLFDSESVDKSAVPDALLISDLEEALGNVGNNQIANTETGCSRPPFKLERLDALIWNGKPALAARGWFYNVETNERFNAFCGFFIDAQPKGTTSEVEEIYLQVRTESDYLRYLPEFEHSLSSIEWFSK